jgi:type 1 fimbria pilin
MIKFFIVSCLFSILMNSAHAFVCNEKESGAQIPANGTAEIEVPVDSDLVLENGVQVNEYANVDNFITCYNQIPRLYIDYLEIRDYIPGRNPAADFGIQVKGVNYFGPLPDYINVLTIENSSTIPLPMKLIMKVINRPSTGVFIRKGDILITAKMHKYAYQYSTANPNHHPEDFTWVFKAANDIILANGTCDINNGQAIIVDLGTLYRSSIANAGAGQSSAGIQEVPLTYQCNNKNGSIDKNYSQNIKIHLSAIPTLFSNNAVQTKTGSSAGGGNLIPGLGIEFYHKESNKLLIPNSESSGFFNTSIVQGVGQGDTLIIAPVKKANATADDIPAGDFNSTATLIMTVQ